MEDAKRNRPNCSSPPRNWPKDTGADWKTYLRTLARAEGMEPPTDDDLQRLDRRRTGKKASNEHWQSPVDPDARIARMKDGATHLAYKAEHAVDLQTEAIVAATVTSADRGDGATGAETLIVDQWNLQESGSQAAVTEVVADKGYHDNRLLAQCADWSVRTYIPERKQKSRVWTDKPAGYERAFRANRRRVRGKKGRPLNRWRSQKCERAFAHVCDTGGGRRSWQRGLVNVSKVHVLKCAAYNLGLLLRKVWGLSKPRSAAGHLTRKPTLRGVARATSPCRRATGPTEWGGRHGSRRRTKSGSHALPFRAASRRAAQAGRLCHPSEDESQLRFSGLTDLLRLWAVWVGGLGMIARRWLIEPATGPTPPQTSPSTLPAPKITRSDGLLGV